MKPTGDTADYAQGTPTLTTSHELPRTPWPSHTISSDAMWQRPPVPATRPSLPAKLPVRPRPPPPTSHTKLKTSTSYYSHALNPST